MLAWLGISQTGAARSSSSTEGRDWLDHELRAALRPQEHVPHGLLPLKLHNGAQLEALQSACTCANFKRTQ